MADMTGVIGRLTNAIMDAANSMSGNLLGQGNQILMSLLGVMVVYHLVMTFVGEDWSMTQVNLVQLFLKWGVISFMLSNWGYVGSFFIDGFSVLAKTASGAGGTVSEFIDMGVGAVRKLFSMGETTAGGQPCTFMGCADAANATTGNGSWWDTLKGMAEIGAAMANIFMLIVALVAKAFAAISIAAMVTAAIAVSLLGAVAIAVGMTIGPIMIPFLLVNSLSFLFDSWLRFMITGGLVKIIAAILLAFVGVAFRELNTLAGTINDPGQFGVDLLVVALIFVIAGMGSYLMWQVPEMANSLLRGSTIGNALSASSEGSKKATQIINGMKK